MTKVTKGTLITGLKVIIREALNYKKEVIILSLLGIFSAIGNGTIPFISGKFFDSIIDIHRNLIFYKITLPAFVFLLFTWTTVQLFTYVIDWMIDFRSRRLGVWAWSKYLVDHMTHLFELPMSFHKANKIGAIGDKINRASTNLENIMAGVVIRLTPQFLSIVIALCIGFFINKILAGILLLGVMSYIFVLIKSIKPLAGYQKDFHEKINGTWGDMYDAIGNAQTIKQSTSEDYERNKLDFNFNNILNNLWIKMDRVWTSLSFFQNVTILFTQLIIFIFSIYFINKGQMTLGSLLAFNGYAAMMFGPFVAIGRQWQEVQNGMVNISEAETVFNTLPEVYMPHDAIKLKDIMGDIEFHNVDFHYDSHKPILKNINFSVRAGEIIALVGESGVGKSSLIDLISGYHFANSGYVAIDGVDIKKIDLKFLRSKIAVVPQEVVLFNDTIKTNIKYGNFDATDGDVEEASKKAHALDFILKFTDKWEQIVGERGVKLSVGQKQRVAIARAILRNPKILILDEPTSALDAGSEHLITQSLEKLMEGKTTFIVAHRLSTVRKADKILVFKEGRIVESGTHEELLKIKDGEYRRLYELQVGLHE